MGRKKPVVGPGRALFQMARGRLGQTGLGILLVGARQRLISQTMSYGGVYNFVDAATTLLTFL